jgi:precorrin-2/cobalt-factor-2 C20-methyltransferase
MKVYKLEMEIVEFLEAHGFDYVYVKRAGREGQQVIRDKEEILKQREYMSVIIANRA